MAMSLASTYSPRPLHGPRSTFTDMQRNFHDKLKQFTVTPVCSECHGCGRPYIEVEKLQNWLKEKCPRKNDTTWADLYLEAANEGNKAGSLSLSDINAPDRECLLVFSILWDIGAPGTIQEFQRCGLTDAKLPLLDLENELKHGSINNPTVLAKKFDQRQWAFRPPKFDWSTSLICKKSTRLPICRREMLSNKGGTALLWRIAVQEEFVGVNLREMSARSKFTDSKFGTCYQFALKTFRDGNTKFFQDEREALWALREHEGMVRYLGDFSHPGDPSCQIKQENGSDRIGTSRNPVGSEIRSDTETVPGGQGGKETKNILLEWGEADLEDFFAERHPPVLGSEVRIFWKELFDVAEALRRMHNFMNKNGEMFDGWHADIKPDNILRVHSSFKLSDPGFARFVRQKPNNTTQISGGTSTYGSPEWERSQESGERVPQSIDIWSLGCVFSIAATWVALGYKGILIYAKLRENSIKDLGNQKQHNLQSHQDEKKRPEADFFHDGSNVLDAIKQWHKDIRPYIRQTDNITGKVLDLVTDNMLQGDPNQRVSAKELCTRLALILVSCPDEPDFPTSLNTKTALNEVQTQNEQLHSQDVPGPSSQKECPIQGRAARDARKSYNVHMARLRSEYFGVSAAGSLGPSISLEQSKVVAFQDRLRANSATNWGVRSRPNHPLANQLEAPVRAIDTSNQKLPPSTPIKGTSTTNQRKPQNVFQAREELEEHAAEQKRKLTNIIKDIVTPNRKKDPFLAEFFRNRDIIFVADNAGSMADSWPEATELLEVLVGKAKNLDEDGMDLYFTHTKGKPNAAIGRHRDRLVRVSTLPKVSGKNDVAKFKESMKDPDFKPAPGAMTDMSLMLGHLLDRYIERLQNKGTNNARKQTIIVLTDGKWDVDKVAGVIGDFVNRWTGLDRDKITSRSVGIQFVQFGNDKDATTRLKYLDDELEGDGIPDIVDTEPSLGDVKKMLIGSFIAEYDVLETLSAISPYQSGSPRMIDKKSPAS